MTHEPSHCQNDNAAAAIRKTNSCQGVCFAVGAIFNIILASAWATAGPSQQYTWIPYALTGLALLCLVALATIPGTTKRQIANLRQDYAARQAAANYRAAADGEL